MAIRLRPFGAAELVARFGGELSLGGGPVVVRVAPVADAAEGDLGPVLSGRYVAAAREAAARGATLLVDAAFAGDPRLEGACVWRHPHAAWALASLLDVAADAPADAAVVGEATSVGANVVLGPRVVVGRNVVLGANCVIGSPGFGWAVGPGGATRRMPQLGGVVIEDDVVIGPLCTVDAGTLAPTRVERGARLDAHVHVGHNTVIGADAIVAAQSGFAGSVRLGRGALVGGQVGVADHVTIGDRARIAAKSGVIGDVPADATYAGYPAVARARWLRALGWLYRSAASS